MSTLVLYHGTTSVCSQKVRLALEEIGLDYDSRLLDLQKGDQFAPDYVALNPEAVVPTLVDDGLVVVESSLILSYLDRVHNGGALMPAAPDRGVAARHWLLRCLAIHGAINTLSFSTVMRDKMLATKSQDEIDASLARMPDPVARAKRRDLLDRGLASVHVDQALRHVGLWFADMNAALRQTAWISGDAFGLSDVALLSYLDRLDRLGFDGLWADRPEIAGWLAAMKERPSYARAIADLIPDGAATAMRTAGQTHWPELSDRWTART